MTKYVDTNIKYLKYNRYDVLMRMIQMLKIENDIDYFCQKLVELGATYKDNKIVLSTINIPKGKDRFFVEVKQTGEINLGFL